MVAKEGRRLIDTGETRDYLSSHVMGVYEKQVVARDKFSTHLYEKTVLYSLLENSSLVKLYWSN